MGVGRALFRATVTLEWVEAEETWVEATAPVRTRAATTARTMSFMTGVPLKVVLLRKFSWTNQPKLLLSGDSTGIRVVGSAHGSGEGAVSGHGDLGMGGGRGDLSGGDCTGENEGGDDCANNELHDWYP